MNAIHLWLVALLGGSSEPPPSHTPLEQSQVYKTAELYIASFRRGEEFKAGDSMAGLVTKDGINRYSLAILSKELARAEETVRKNIVRLLETAGLNADSPAENEFRVIRDRGVLNVLIVEGFAKDDGAADLAAEILRTRVMPNDLATFGAVFANSLKRGNMDYLYLTAKAKFFEALPFVNRLDEQTDSKNTPEQKEAIGIAKAALGNKELEQEFIQAALDAEKFAPQAPGNRFYDVGDAKDGSLLAQRIRTPGLIGSPKTLELACQYLRSRLKSYVPDVKERSVRYAALDALRYNYPDERVLFDPVNVSDWAAAEQFCTSKLGVVFDGPTPDIQPDQVYPIRIIPSPRRK